jgi:hypothetical protein
LHEVDGTAFDGQAGIEKFWQTHTPPSSPLGHEQPQGTSCGQLPPSEPASAAASLGASFSFPASTHVVLGLLTVNVVWVGAVSREQQADGVGGSDLKVTSLE